MTRNSTRISYVNASTANMRRPAGLAEVAYTRDQNNSKFHAPNISQLDETQITLPSLSEAVRMFQNTVYFP